MIIGEVSYIHNRRDTYITDPTKWGTGASIDECHVTLF